MKSMKIPNAFVKYIRKLSQNLILFCVCNFIEK